MFKVIWENEGGELDRKCVETDAEAAEALCEMVRAAGVLQHGDRIKVIETAD